MSASDSRSIPLISEVTFRIAEDGAYFGLDLSCSDGAVRSAAFPSSLLTSMIVGALWSASEAGKRGVKPFINPEDLERMREGAPGVSEWRLDVTPEGPLLEMRVGAAVFAVRVPREGVLALGRALNEYMRLDTAR